MDPLNNVVLREVLKAYAPDVDADDDGIFAFKWTSTETFYRHTEDYVAAEQRLAYKHALRAAFPGREGAL